jgi:hypothetical protein
LAEELLTLGCGDGRVFTLRRLPGAFAVGYEMGADVVTRIYGKLVGEFFETLGRVVVGAEVFVNGGFDKPKGSIGPYFIVAVEGAEFGACAASRDRDLVAVDLSMSGIRILHYSAFWGCTQLVAVAFPPELETIDTHCFGCCGALHAIDLELTQLKELGYSAFGECGVTRVSVPASLRVLGWNVFAYSQLKNLDLSACAAIDVRDSQTNSLLELSLPLEGFAAAAGAFLRGSSIEILRVDVGEVEINGLFPQLEGLGVDKLRVVSKRVGECEWQRSEQSAWVELTDPVAVTTPASVTMTAWRELPKEWKPFLRAIDLSGLALEVQPPFAGLEDFDWLERLFLPTGMRKLPREFFR